MKKTGASSGRNTRPSVRSSSSGPVRSSSSSRKSSGARSSRKSKKKSGAGKAIAIAAAVIIVGGAAAVGFLYKQGYFETKYPVTLADGTVVEYTLAELQAQFPQGVYAQGIVIDGINVGGMTIDEARAAVSAVQSDAPIALDISLNLDNNIYPLDLSALTLENNMEEILGNAINYAVPSPEATPEELVACLTTRQQLAVNPVTYNTAYTLNSDGISGIVHNLLDPMSSEAQDAVITGFNVDTCQFEYTPSVKGYVIDVDGAANAVKDLLDSATYTGVVEVSAEVTEPGFTTEEIQNNFGMITSTTTNTTTNNSRNHNINLACQTIDGFFMVPGAEFKFNTDVGPRTPERGYEQAGTIQNGEIKDDYGGGVCQVSTTIYQSVIKSDLNVIERHPHQWPSSYAVAGTDAAVDLPSNQDFIFSNNKEYPVALHAYYDNDNYTITVEIYGRLFDDGVYLGFEGEVTGHSDATTVYVANSSMAVGTRSQTRGSHNGTYARSYQIWYDANGNEIDRVQLENTVYSPVPAIVDVGVLNPDGSIATMDPATGNITSATVTTSSETSESTVGTDPTTTTESTTPTESTASADPTPEPPPPADPTPVPVDPEPAPAEDGET